MFKIKALLLKVLLCPGADQALRDKRACDQRNLTTDSQQISKVVTGFESKMENTQWSYACF